MDSNLKIAIGSDAFPPTTDGISSVAENYAAVLNRNHCRAVVVTPKNPNQQDSKYDYEIFRYKSIWIPSKEGYSVGWPFKPELSAEIINKHFDLLHSHAPLATSYYFRLVNRMRRVPTVLTYHTKYEYDIEKRVPTAKGKEFAKKFILKNVNAADEVWVTSLGSKESLEKIGYSGDIILMPNGCDLPKKDISANVKNNIRQRHAIPPGVPVFIYTGRMIWYKNIKKILDSCRALKTQGKDFRLIMLGFGADEIQIKLYYRRLGIADKIIWLGKSLDRGEIQNYFACADLLLFPSVFDTNGLVVREAASCATPALLINGSCAAEGISDCKTAFLCEETAESITKKLFEIMDKRDLLEKVGKNAQQSIYLSWDDAVKKAYERYCVVIDSFYKSGKDKQEYKF
ncbi:MAG: glycosyltransferase [Clostridiales bacterium]|nr:glycosyltransferase [Clostridiales bacterium]